MYFIVIAMSMAGSLQAAPVGEATARQIADKFFSSKASRFNAPPGSSAPRLAYTAEHGSFYVFDRGSHGGFVVVSGDDRLPQVLGYGNEGDFSTGALPPAVQYWMNEMDRQIAYLKSHGDVEAHHPAKRTAAVEPLLTSHWDQSAPFNNYCPVYADSVRCVTGCVATASAQIMNYYQWPPVGRGSHSYVCYVNNNTPVELSADFSQSVYRWDLMLDDYDESSSPESCDAVARLMSDVGISMDMEYGSSSGAWGWGASEALLRYFAYSNKYYWLYTDHYTAAEWDQLLVDELSKSRPVMYLGYSADSGHAFVLDGFDNDGYYHVNWGWGGDYDGYYLVSLLNPATGWSFQSSQRGLFGLVPETQADAVDDVLFIRGYYGNIPSSPVPLGTSFGFEINNISEGNMLDTTDYVEWEGNNYYYAVVPMKLGLYDKNGVECVSEMYDSWNYIDEYIPWSAQYPEFNLPQSLEDGEYRLTVSYSIDGNENYDQPILDLSAKEAYIKVIVQGDTAYIKDCFLYNTYGIESFVLPEGIRTDDPIDVDVKLYYDADWLSEGIPGPAGNVYLSLLKDGVEVVAGPMCEVMLPANTEKTYTMQIQAPSQPGLYDLVLNDESGSHIMEMDGWLTHLGEVMAPVYVLPPCQELLEDFESMTANSSTSDKDVQGNFTTWSFTKSGVRSPGEGKCHGVNAVMMKKPSALYTTQPLQHNFLLAQATVLNPVASAAKYTLEYSLDDGSTWTRVQTIEGLDAAEVPGKRTAVVSWKLGLTAAQPALFRIAMTGGGTAATYVDDIALYCIDTLGDVNGDGEINIADINAIIDIILSGGMTQAADVNSDSEVNIADINAIIDLIIK